MRIVAMVLGSLALAACSADAPPRLPAQVYQGPEPMTAPPLVAKLVRMPRDSAAAGVLRGLKSLGLTTDHVDLGRGFVAARYSGDPGAFVDCGILGFGDGSVPAAQQSVALNDLAAGPVNVGRMVRDLQLDTRMTISAQPYGGETSVVVDATHVLVKTLRVDDQVVRSEAISFDSKSTGQFKKGTRCNSTGKLEELALDGVPGPLVSLDLPSDRQFAGLPATAVQESELPPPTQGNTGSAATSRSPFDCSLLTAGNADEACQLLALLAPYRAGTLGARLMSDDVPLREGEHVVVELDLPGGATNVQLSYVDAIGVVTHLPVVKMRGDIRHSVYATGHVISEPFGQEMILVLASTDESLLDSRPVREPISSYLAAMRDMLRQPAVPLNAEAVLVTSTDR